MIQQSAGLPSESTLLSSTTVHKALKIKEKERKKEKKADLSLGEKQTSH